MAQKCAALDMYVVAGCHSTRSEGAKLLGSANIVVEPVDVTSHASIRHLYSAVEQHLGEDNHFHGLVNNAGCMTMGEFEWLTPEIIRWQLEVNLLGTMNVTHELLPLLRTRMSSDRQARIINVTSHCGIMALPTLAPYAASKGGLVSFNDSLRIELRKFGINVINFVPGSFVMQSRIMAGQLGAASDMWDAMSEEQQQFYCKYFHDFNNYLTEISKLCPTHPAPVDQAIIDAFERAISSEQPKYKYVVEPWRYSLYRGLFSLLPESRLRDYVVERFVQMPKYEA